MKNVIKYDIKYYDFGYIISQKKCFDTLAILYKKILFMPKLIGQQNFLCIHFKYRSNHIPEVEITVRHQTIFDHLACLSERHFAQTFCPSTKLQKKSEI